jgi:chromosome segregation ATPase
MRLRYDYKIWLVIIACLVFAYLANSCASARRVGSDDTILSHQQQLADLENRNQELERRLIAYNDTVGNSIGELEAIRARSTGLEGTIDETIKLFDEYQRAVERLTRSYQELRSQTENVDEGSSGTGSDTGN